MPRRHTKSALDKLTSQQAKLDVAINEQKAAEQATATNETVNKKSNAYYRLDLKILAHPDHNAIARTTVTENPATLLLTKLRTMQTQLAQLQKTNRAEKNTIDTLYNQAAKAQQQLRLLKVELNQLKNLPEPQFTNTAAKVKQSAFTHSTRKSSTPINTYAFLQHMQSISETAWLQKINHKIRLTNYEILRESGTAEIQELRVQELNRINVILNDRIQVVQSNINTLKQQAVLSARNHSTTPPSAITVSLGTSDTTAGKIKVTLTNTGAAVGTGRKLHLPTLVQSGAPCHTASALPFSPINPNLPKTPASTTYTK